MLDTLLAIVEAERDWNPVVLVLLSFLLYAIVSNLATSRFVTTRLGAVESSRSALPRSAVGIVLELLRFGYYLGIPFLAVQLGWVNLRALGFGQLDWAEGIRWAIIILLAAWLILMVIWLPYLRATADIPAQPNTTLSFPRRLVELIYMQAHWAFYRAVAIGFFTGIIRGDIYWGAAAGLFITFLEALTNPRNRAVLSVVGQADTVVWNMAQAVINALAFIVTVNFYLLVLIQLVLELTVPHLRSARSAQPSTVSPIVTRQQMNRE